MSSLGGRTLKKRKKCLACDCSNIFNFFQGPNQHGDAPERGRDESCDGRHDEVKGHARVFEIVKLGQISSISMQNFN